MAIVKVQGPLGVNEGDASVTKAWTSTPTAGNLLIAIGRGENNISNASISGWTLAVSVQFGSNGYGGIWYKVAGAGEGDVTLDWTSSTATQLIISEWSGIASGTLDKTASTATTGAGVTSRSSGTTATTTADEELCIAGFFTGNTTSLQSFSNSFTDEFSLDTSPAYMASLIVASTGAYETTMSWTTSRVAGGCIATFKSQPILLGALRITYSTLAAM